MQIRLDVSTQCQLKCPICPTARGLLDKTAVKYGTVSFNNFKKVIDDNSRIKEVEISNYGEVFLNKELHEILEYAYKSGVRITIDNGVNLNYASDVQLESLVKFKVQILKVSIDGATQEIYGKYRVNGNLEKVLENIQIINAYKKQYNSEYPNLFWQFILFSYNVQEVEKARSLAESLNMSFFIKENWDKYYFPVDKDNFYAKEYESFDIEETEESSVLDGKKFPLCLQMWQSPQINWNGEVLGCCVNFWGSYGNAFTEGLGRVLKSEEYIVSQKLLAEGKFTSKSPCLKCDIFRNDVFKKNRLNYFVSSPFKFSLFMLKRLL